LAIVRDMGQRARLEYPVGRSLYEFTGWLSHPRISPRRDLIAFVEHPGVGVRACQRANGRAGERGSGGAPDIVSTTPDASPDDFSLQTISRNRSMGVIAVLAHPPPTPGSSRALTSFPPPGRVLKRCAGMY
jgi:hypothetical protein